MAGKPGDEFDNDDSIPGEARLLRRIAPAQVTMAGNTHRPQSDAFSNSPDGTGTSVDVWEEGREPADMLIGHEGFGLVWLKVQDVRDAGLGVVRNALPRNPHHALIQGRKTKSTQRKLAKAVQWIKLPDTQD